MRVVDPDQGSELRVITLRSGDILRVMSRPLDTIVNNPPIGLTLQEMGPPIVRAHNDMLEVIRWVSYYASLHCSVRLDRLVDVSFRRYREQLVAFYDYRNMLLRS